MVAMYSQSTKFGVRNYTIFTDTSQLICGHSIQQFLKFGIVNQHTDWQVQCIYTHSVQHVRTGTVIGDRCEAFGNSMCCFVRPFRLRRVKERRKDILLKNI